MKHKTHDTQNLFMAIILAVMIMGAWEYFIELPRKRLEMQTQHTKATIEKTIEVQKAKSAENLPKSREDALTGEAIRLPIRSDHLHGSLSLKGLRIDDLTLAQYHETASPSSPEVVLFSPTYGDEGYFSEFGWLPPASGGLTMPSPDTVWTSDSSEIVPEKPVHLTWKNPEGTVFDLTITLDKQYLFTVTQSVKDANGAPVSLQNYAYINRVYDIKKHLAIYIMQEGPIAVYDGKLKEVAYKDISAGKSQATQTETGGWVGITDKYWFSAIIPTDEKFNSRIFSYTSEDGHERFQTDYNSITAKPEHTLRFFAGAKELHILDDYAQRYNITLFDRAVDFGMYYFLTKPFFIILTFFNSIVGNFGIAIMMMTVLIKIIMYPMANKSYQSMAQMSLVRPKIMEIQERFKDDKIALNKEMLELYKREKINPASGCLPALIQIPVFFSLYKVLYVTLAMRQAPFFGWIHDLSAPDPSNLFTLFGTLNTHILAWAHMDWLHIGAWPLMMAITMFIQQSQSPPPPDPAQAKVMKFLPVLFLFMFSSVASGLVIYWTWSNLLSILQQARIKAKHGPIKR